ncbi:MAG: energy transducer TonB [Bacteroidota bacterium]
MQVKKNPKADLNRWSHIFFLTGLAIMLFISYQMVEWKSFNTSDLANSELNVGEDLEQDIPITNQLTPPPPPPPPPPAATQVIQVVENNLDIEETIIESTETDQNQEIVEVVEIADIEEVEEEEIVYVPFAVIEDVPIYPGCEGESDNSSRKKCMETKVMEYVQKNFNTDLAAELGLEGRQRISVQFKIDKHGQVINVRARAPHPRLEKEAVGLISKLPRMTPGKQRGKPVGVIYALPILFQVEDLN